MVFNTTSTIFQLHRGGQFSKYPEKPTDLPQVTDKLFHIMLYRLPRRLGGIQTQKCSGDMHR